MSREQKNPERSESASHGHSACNCNGNCKNCHCRSTKGNNGDVQIKPEP